MKTQPVYRIEMIETVRPAGYSELRKGQVIRTEAIGVGTNWIKIRLPKGPIKTLFNFEATWTILCMGTGPHDYQRVRPGSNIERCTICKRWRFAPDCTLPVVVGIPA